MKEYDERQLNLMIKKINMFKSQKMHLGNLINDLEALLNVLEEKDKNWSEEFKGHWWDLEQVYAAALDEERTNLDPEDVHIVFEAIENIKSLVRKKLELHEKNTGHEDS